MWVWNDDEEEKVQKKVLYIFFMAKGKNGKYQRYLMMKHVLIFTSIVRKLNVKKKFLKKLESEKIMENGKNHLWR